MKFTSYLLATATLLSFSLVSCSKSSTATNNTKIEKEVDRICDSVIEHSNLPGMIVGIWSENNFTYLKGRGINNKSTKDSMQPLLPFRIGSNTKTVVVTAILQLADENKLSIDDTIGKFFPGFPNGSIVTVRMLCNMTSGIYNYTDTKAFVDAIEANPMRNWKPLELVNLVWNSDSVYKYTPNTTFYYSNTNTVMLGIIIEQLTGNSLADELQNRFFSKLSMNNTLMPPGNYMPANGIRGYMYDNATGKFDDVTQATNVSWGWAAGALISNVMDVRTWVTQLVTGTLVSPGLQEQRFTSGISTTPGLFYGLGMFTRGHDMWGHNGGLPGYTSVMMHHRTKDITYVIFFNTQDSNSDPTALFLRLISVVNPEL